MKTLQEIRQFCIENAGGVASGIGEGNREYTGRILAYGMKHQLILLENDSLPENNDIPNPLPRFPYEMDNWGRVLSPCRKGIAVKAISVKLIGAGSVVKNDKEKVIGIVKSITQNLCHPECDLLWCHRKYAGLL